MLSAIEKIRYQDACIQTDAIFALEGFEQILFRCRSDSGEMQSRQGGMLPDC